jgi:hypothetical protein
LKKWLKRNSENKQVLFWFKYRSSCPHGRAAYVLSQDDLIAGAMAKMLFSTTRRPQTVKIFQKTPFY